MSCNTYIYILSHASTNLFACFRLKWCGAHQDTLRVTTGWNCIPYCFFLLLRTVLVPVLDSQCWIVIYYVEYIGAGMTDVYFCRIGRYCKISFHRSILAAFYYHRIKCFVIGWNYSREKIIHREDSFVAVIKRLHTTSSTLVPEVLFEDRRKLRGVLVCQ